MEPIYMEDTHTHVYIRIEREREREIDFQELTPAIVGLASLKCAGQASRLETQVRVDIAVLSLDTTGRQAGNSGWVSALQSCHQAAAGQPGEWGHIRGSVLVSIAGHPAVV